MYIWSTYTTFIKKRKLKAQLKVKCHGSHSKLFFSISDHQILFMRHTVVKYFSYICRACEGPCVVRQTFPFSCAVSSKSMEEGLFTLTESALVWLCG
jgi:hypothetical protein